MGKGEVERPWLLRALQSSVNVAYGTKEITEMRQSSTIRRLVLSLLAVAIGAAPGLSSGSASATSGANARWSTFPARTLQAPSNFRGGTPLATGPNVNISNKTGAQSETTVAIDPTDRTHLYASSNDNLETFQHWNGLYQSTDGGRTWVNDNFNDADFCYDTWLDFNAAGDVFLAYECSDQRIAYKKVGTNTWVKTKFTIAGSFPDRDMVKVDRQAGSPRLGSVYIGYDDNGANNTAYVLHSADGFGGWARSTKINDANPTIGVNVAVGADGSVYATWEDFLGKKILSDRSTDGGATWGTDHVVTNYRTDTTNFIVCIPPQNIRCVVPFPLTSAAPAGTTYAGRLYVTYSDTSPTGANWNTYFRYSDDGGTTWSSEIKINDDTNNAYHFFPAISVAPNGTIAVSSYDTRNDPTSHAVDQYVSFSRDGGATWSPNQRVSTVSSDETVGGANNNQYGDYEGIDAYPGTRARFYVVWTDARPGNQDEDMYGAKASLR
jgi:hypothetical protein